MAWARSRATIIGPVSARRVRIGCLVSSARMSFIGRLRSISTTLPPSAASSTAGRKRAGSRSSSSRNTPSWVILPTACRSAEQETPIPIGSEAPWRGRRITRTSWQKYLPPNWAPTPRSCVSFRISASSSRSRKARASGRARCRQRVQILGRGELHRLQVELGAHAADHDGEVIGRAGGRAEGEDLLLEKGDHPVVGEDRRGRLEQEGLVGRAAALGHEQELVGVLALGGDVDLRRQIVAGVGLLERRKGRELAVAQVLLAVGLAHALGEGGLVGALGPHVAALFGHDDGGAGVLAHRQHAAGRDVGVLQEVVGDELVVAGRLGVVEDLGELGEMGRAQQVVDVDHRLLGEQAQRRRLDDQDFAPRAPSRSARRRSVSLRYGVVSGPS